ncbi:MAG: hypothetical protein ROM54_12310, partial [Anaerobiospirillum sp.]|nr:hypothetical protein [Anaerobiospirillum sp.]
MKQTSSALTFLLAQYRAIFKRAYVKGIAAAVLMTAGLAAGQAQAADNFYFSNSGGTWHMVSETAPADNAMYAQKLGGNAYKDINGAISGDNAVISGGLFNIGGDSTAKNYLKSVTSGTVTAAYGNAKTGNMTATENHVYVVGSGTVTANGSTTKSRGLIYGAYVTAQAGLAEATKNSVVVAKAQDQNENVAASDGYIGGRAQGASGATVEGNKVSISGHHASALQVVNASDNEYDVIGGIALHNGKNSSGTYQANQNIIDLQYIQVTEAGAEDKGFNITGGLVSPDGDAEFSVIAQGNEVTIANSNLATTNSGNLTVKIVGGNSAAALANGTVTLKNNTVTLDNTTVTKSGGYSGSLLIAGGATTGLGKTLNQSKSIEATGNKVVLKATDDKSIGADIIAGASITNVAQGANSVTLTATGNSVTVGNNVTVSTDEGLAGAYISASGSAIQSLKASNNVVTVKGTVHGDIAAVKFDKNSQNVASGTYIDFSNNKVILESGSVSDSGSLMGGFGNNSLVDIKAGATYKANNTSQDIA